MALTKLIFQVETGPNQFTEEVEVLFNPSTFSLHKSVNWDRLPRPGGDAPKSQFTFGEPATLSLELFFDTWAERTNVTELTGRIAALAAVAGELHRPPCCRLQWGTYSFEGYLWMLIGLDQSFSLFLDDGTPVRATLGCELRQWRSDDEENRLLKKSSPDVAKERVVRRGETLVSLAAEEYADAGQWRRIAAANGILNPRRLTPGQVLTVPPLRPGKTGRS